MYTSFIILFIVLLGNNLLVGAKEQFNEDLTLRSLSDGKLMAHFDFTTHVDVTNPVPGASCKKQNIITIFVHFLC